MTSLEGKAIVKFFRDKGKERVLSGLLAENSATAKGKLRTTNHFARLCLEQKEIEDGEQGTWNFEPCVFLENGICTIYEVRPFGCRSFGSKVKCSASSSAEIEPLHLTVNTILMQIIEHLNSNGGFWGYMTDILKDLTGCDKPTRGTGLLSAESLPGFLIEPSEQKEVHNFLAMLYESPSGKKGLAELIDNSMLME
jgi:hypothetical protein